MKPDDHGKRQAIVEQWWIGATLLVFWAIVIVGSFYGCSAKAAELPPPVQTIYVSWTQPPPPEFLGEEVLQWKIYRTFPLPRVQIAVTDTPFTWITVTDGEKFVVTSVTASSESRDSVEWTARLPIPDPVVRATLQTSRDMKTWEDHQVFEFRKSNAEFFRIKIEQLPP